MKKILSIILAAVFCTLTAAGQTSAKKVLDATADKLTRNGDIQLSFKADQFTSGQQNGSAFGNMQISGNKFKITTPDMITWYNGQTQWSYVLNNEEVNISTPTEEEQQHINPYAFVNIYKKGYNYSMRETTLRGKACYEVTLIAQDKKSSLPTIILDIEKGNRVPLCVRLQHDAQTWTRITIQSYEDKQSFPANHFEFNRHDFPQAEIIDLR